MASKLYVGNLSYDTTDESLERAFAQHGEVVSARVVTDRDTGRSRGFGFVEMNTDEEAKAAKDGLDGQEVDGRQIRVDEARESGGGGGGGGGRRGGGGGGGGGGYGGGGGRSW